MTLLAAITLITMSLRIAYHIHRHHPTLDTPQEPVYDRARASANP